MKLLEQILQRPGWHLSGPGHQIQVAVKNATQNPGELHLHQSLSEYFLVLVGWIELRIGPTVRKVHAGDLLEIEPGEPHQLLRTSTDAHYLIFMKEYQPNDRKKVSN